MSERFTEHFVSRTERFTLGLDQRTGSYFLSTPVSGYVRAAEYEAHFRISADEYARFRSEPESAATFLEDCRLGRNADRLINGD